jgi:thiamine-phosphate pyrophosphorylase
VPTPVGRCGKCRIVYRVPSPDAGKILRLVDANANRAREALRVWEDYARFVLDDQELSLAVKAIRHDLSAALQALAPDAILWRDTPGDVGRENKVAHEGTRAGVAEVVTAAGKRLTEALRTIEEYGKIGNSAVAANIEAARYAAYDLELRLARTLRPAGAFSKVKLYVLLTESVCKIPWLDAARAAIAGGADCIQLREKNLDGGEFLTRAKLLAAECRARGVLCIINDRPDIAVLSGADGVHVGQTDLPCVEARRIVGGDRIVGVSTHNLEQARQAVRDGADYVGIGPVFRSTTKPRDFVAGLETARQVAAGIKIPAVAIAGINHQNVDEVLAAGIKAVAVSAAVLACDDVAAATRSLKAKIDAAAAGP